MTPTCPAAATESSIRSLARRATTATPARGDGCAADCKASSRTSTARRPGKPCVYRSSAATACWAATSSAIHRTSARGCSAACRLEPGYVCDAPPATPDAEPPATLPQDRVRRRQRRKAPRRATTATSIDGDGCSAACTLEPDCSDGRVRCRSAATPSSWRRRRATTATRRTATAARATAGWRRGSPAPTRRRARPAQLNLLVTYRDFIGFPLGTATRHPDFEIFAGDGHDAEPGEADAGRDGKPVHGRPLRAGRRDGACAPTTSN